MGMGFFSKLQGFPSLHSLLNSTWPLDSREHYYTFVTYIIIFNQYKESSWFLYFAFFFVFFFSFPFFKWKSNVFFEWAFWVVLLILILIGVFSTYSFEIGLVKGIRSGVGYIDLIE